MKTIIAGSYWADTDGEHGSRVDMDCINAIA